MSSTSAHRRREALNGSSDLSITSLTTATLEGSAKGAPRCGGYVELEQCRRPIQGPLMHLTGSEYFVGMMASGSANVRARRL